MSEEDRRRALELLELVFEKTKIWIGSSGYYESAGFGREAKAAYAELHALIEGQS